LRKTYVDEAETNNVSDDLKAEANKFKASRTWRQKFYGRYDLVTRKRTNKKALDLPTRIAKWMDHHKNLRMFLRTGTQQSTVYGRFDVMNRYNVDQVPAPFTFEADSTLEFKGAKTVVIRGCKIADGDKRFCTIQVCCRPVSNGESQPRIAVIFRGSGTVYEREKFLYDPRVDVYFQPKAWADRPTSLAWFKKTFKKHLEERAKEEGKNPEFMLFCDNLDSQAHEEFLNAIKAEKGCRFLLPAGETEMCQPIDGGIGAVLKKIISFVQDEWLDIPGNLEAWEGDPNASFVLTASVRRVLITKWVGDAWEIMTTDETYRNIFRSCFERTGALITADGTLDEVICPMKGLQNYKVPEIAESSSTPNAAAVDGSSDTTVEVDRLEYQQNLINHPEVSGTEDDVDGNDDVEVTFIENNENHVVEKGGDESGASASEAESAVEDEEDGQDQMEESWNQALNGAMYGLPTSMKPILDVTKLPDRCLKGKDRFIMVVIDGEWEITTTYNRIRDDSYRLKLYFTNEWAVARLEMGDYGRENESPNRWLLLEDVV
jgi:hypothetical protein